MERSLSQFYFLYRKPKIYSKAGFEVFLSAIHTQLLPGFTASSLPSVNVNLKPFFALPFFHLIGVYVPFTQ